MPHRVIFIHQNLPGQFKHLLFYCADNPEFEVVVVGEKRRVLSNLPHPPRGVQFHVYDVADIQPAQVPVELWTTTNAMRRGRAVAQCLQNIKESGFVPDVVYGHPGWGDMLHVRDVFPNTRIVNYCEFYFNREGQDLNFDPEFQGPQADTFKIRTDNMTQLVSMVDADAGISPTRWQRSRYPELLRSSISVVHDGVDLQIVRPDPKAYIALPDTMLRLDRHTPIITYVSRNLEPYRGFHVFMRALPAILKTLPHAHVVIVGGNEASYSNRLPDGKTYRDLMLAEVGAQLDTPRVHFLGRIPYAQYLRVLQVSRVHVYLTYPFVLSWSMLDAMAMGSIVVGSKTAPVQEVIDDGVNGLLVDFFSHRELADAVCRACVAHDVHDAIREAGRATIEQRFNLRQHCLGAQLALLCPTYQPASTNTIIA